MMAERPGRIDAAHKRSVLADDTYEAIRTLIIGHEIPPGQHVGIDQFAGRFSVSQTPVREALARLESDGLVAKVPLRGYETTALLTVQEFDDLFRFRTLIEPWAAGEAARRGPRLDVEAIEHEVRRAELLTREPGVASYSTLVDHDTRFHTLVARASGNPFVEEAFQRTHCHMHLLRVHRASQARHDEGYAGGAFVRDMFAEYYASGGRPLAIDEHTSIAQAIASGRSESARELMLEHIDSSRRRFIPVVEALSVG